MRYAEALARKVEEFCAANIGYDQSNRWGSNECDCSSLIYRAIYAIDPSTKLNRRDPRYTGTLARDLQAIGFTRTTYASRQRGDVLLNSRNHVVLYLGNNKVGGARIDERGKVSGGQGGDQTGREVCVHACYNYPWDYVLRPPQVEVGGGGSVSSSSAASNSTSLLDVDGYWGNATTRALQRHFGTPVDGVVSSQPMANKSIMRGCPSFEYSSKPQGSTLICAMQRELGVEVDGFFGPASANALIKRFQSESGATVLDGRLDAPSITIKAMQRRLNAGRF